MPVFARLRANAHYAKGTSLLIHTLPQVNVPNKARDTIRQAIVSLRKATELRPDFGHAWHNLGNAYYYSGEFLEQVTNAVRQSDELADHTETFQTALEGNYQNSLRALDQAIRFMPDSAEAHNNRGRTLVALKRDDEALKEFNIALELNPSYTKAAGNKVTLQEMMAAAQNDVPQGDSPRQEDAQNADSDAYRDYIFSGNRCFNSGQYQDAIEHYNHALTLLRREEGETATEFAWAYRCRGDAYRATSQYQTAIGDYSMAIELDPVVYGDGTAGNFAEAALYGRASIYKELGEYQRAIEDFRVVIEMGRDHSKAAYDGRADGYYQLGEYQRAIKDYTDLIGSPGWPSATNYYNRARTYEMLGEEQLAREDYEKGQEIEQANK